MPRLARAVFSGVAHHITQRGNRRGNVFFNAEDRRTYLAWLRDYCTKYGVEILAYCLMTNHVHVVAVPTDESALEEVFRPLHTRYAQRINRRKCWKGHLWQGRFFSSALDEDYLWAAIRYVERNPVRARLVRKAENYPWSSAAAHCGLKKDDVLTAEHGWWRRFKTVGNWSMWLAQGDVFTVDQGKSLMFVLNNTTSFKSFAYGAPPAPAYERSTFGPAGNMRQTYWWTEPRR
jgi:putative transposase